MTCLATGTLGEGSEPVAKGTEPVHWLVDVARSAGLAGAEGLDIKPGTATPDAWAAVRRVSGISGEELARHVATHFQLGLADLQTAQPQALKLVPEKVARRHMVFPLRENDRELAVATSDPNDLDAEQALQFASGRAAVFEIAPPKTIQEAIAASYAPESVVESLLARVDTQVAESVRLVEDVAAEAVAVRDVEAAPVITLTNLILQDAISRGSSDIHIEPGRAGGTVRFRVDGVLQHYMRMPMLALNRVVSRIKIIGKLDIADRLRPQDGRARVQVDSRTYDLRISTVPTREAEKVVIRILDSEGAACLEELGLPDRELERLRRLLVCRDGIVIVTGPTGSGKTTTLYAALQELATGDVNIMTIEDPIEYDLAGITQIQVEPRQDVTFASALRAILRQDPDVILVGEVRDLETATAAVQSAMTGHVVMTTLHTNDAVGTVARLVDIGLERWAIGQTLRGAVAQRLLRCVCRDCAQRIEGDLSPKEKELAAAYGVEPAVRAVGCPHCGRTGYRGRIPVAEVMIMSAELEELISSGASGADLQRAAIAAGMRPMREVALERVRAGETTLEEIDRTLGERAEGPALVRAGPAEREAELEEAELEEAGEPQVLVVDDDPVSRKIARAVLEKSGFKISEACDGVEALERIRAGEDYSLVVLDLQMPKMGGQEVLVEVRKSIATVGLPVIILTGSEEAGTEVELIEAGADDYLRKPLDPDRFVARVNAVLRRVGA